MGNRAPGVFSRPDRERLRSRRPRFDLLEERHLLSTFTVKNTNDSGAGTLRQAILDANGNPNSGGPDLINFAITGGGLQTIAPASQLPTIDEAVVIDASTQSGSQLNTAPDGTNAKLFIQLNGTNLPSAQSFGLVVNSKGVVIRGLEISGFKQAAIADTKLGGNSQFEGNFIGASAAGDVQFGDGNAVGILLQTGGNTIGGVSGLGTRNLVSGNSTAISIGGVAASNNLIAGNLIGPTAGGLTPIRNGDGVILTVGATANTIGGLTAIGRNLISANGTGVKIFGDATSGNVVVGNYVGADATGNASLSNLTGIEISAPGNTIGGGSQSARNLIAGNSKVGLVIDNSVSTLTASNVVAGNYVGVNVTGSSAVPNAVGIEIIGSSSNTIGGTASTLGNLIAGNNSAGVSITASASPAAMASGNVVLGNFIGTNASGLGKIPNVGDGIDILNTGGNLIGGSFAAARNVISGNSGSYGVNIDFTNVNPAVGNQIQGNYIGVDSTGQAALGNNGVGVRLGTSGNTVGGDVAGAGNVISGNLGDGVFVSNAVITGNVIAGNLVGTDSTGAAAVGNVGVGVHIASGSNTTVGGLTAATRNVISGNKAGINTGIANGTPGTLVIGNFVGTDRTGNVALGNGTGGDGVIVSGSGATIGGTATGAGNVISGNSGYGLDFSGVGANGSVALGNRIGTNSTGSAALANSLGGVLLGASGNILGGSVAGSGNVISGNAGPGVLVSASAVAADNNVVAGNLIGVDASGTTALANTAGVVLTGVSGTTVGGTAVASRNIISGNKNDGVSLSGATATGNLIAGNYIGTNGQGIAAIANGANGITISSPGNSIGGLVANLRNVIAGNAVEGISIATGGSGTVIGSNFIGIGSTGAVKIANGDAGIVIRDKNVTVGGVGGQALNVISGNTNQGILVTAAATNAVIAGNYIGLGQNGVTKFGNGDSGVVVQSASNVTIGGTSQVSRNVISGNLRDGIQFTGSGSLNDLVLNNLIGSDNSGTTPEGNLGWGISIEGPSGISIGSTAATPNIIAFNGSTVGGLTGGIGIKAGTSNTIQFADIFSNVGLGIDLNEDGVTPNTPGSPHTGPNNLQSFPVLQSALTGPTTTTVNGVLDSVPNSTYTVQFFVSDVADPTNFGEGQVYLGSGIVTTNATGSAIFNIPIPVHTNAEQFLTAIATDSAGNTSEFAQDIVIANADTELALTISAMPDSVPVGQTLTYTITVKNNGPNDATGVQVTDSLPSNVSYISSSTTFPDTTSFSAGIVTANLGKLPVGVSKTVTIKVTPTAAGTITNTAQVKSAETDPPDKNISATVISTAVPSADLAVTLTPNPTPLLLGQVLTYTLNVKNNGPSPATNVVISTDDLPPNVTNVSATSSQVNITQISPNVVGTIDSLAVGATATITIMVTPTATGPVVITARALAKNADKTPEFDPVSNNNSASATVQVNPSADLAISATASPNPGLVGQPLTYTVTVKNNGLSDATNVSVIDTLPSSVNFVSAVASSGGTAVRNGQMITGTFPTLVSGASATITIVVTPTISGQIVNTATTSASQGDPNLENNKVTLPWKISPAADLAIALSASPNPVPVGGLLQYTITVTNNGPNAASGVVATDTLNSNLVVQSVSPSQGTFLTNNGVVTLNFGSILNGGSATAVIAVKPLAGAAGIVFDTANVVATEADPNTGNNTATVSSAVNASADLSLALTAAPNPVLVNTNLTYTLVVSNNGPSTATGVLVTDTIPAGATLQSVATDGSFTQSGSVITIRPNSILNGASSTITIVVRPTTSAAVNIVDSASVSSDVNDPTSGNNLASVTTRVNPSADLSLTVVDTPDPLLIGGNLTYTIAVTNNGPSDAGGVVLTDVFPAGATYVSSTLPSGASIGISADFSAATVSLLGLANGATKNLTIVVKPTTTGSLKNTASLSAVQADPNPANSTVTTFTTVIPSADLGVTLAALPPTLLLGQDVSFIANVVNRGPSVASNIVLNLTIPAGVTINDRPSPAGGTIKDITTNLKSGTYTISLSGRVATLTIPSLPNGALATLKVTARTDVLGSLSATAAVSSDVQDSSAANNSITSQAVNVVPSADLSVTQTVAVVTPADAPPQLPSARDTVEFTIVVTNNGPSLASNVMLTDVLPAGAKLLSFTGTDGTSYSDVDGVVKVPIGLLPSGVGTTFFLTLEPTQRGTINNVASLSAGEADPDASNSASVQPYLVVGSPGELGFVSPTFSVNENAGFATITLTRQNGTDGAASVHVTTTGGTAVAGTNYVATDLDVFFADGQASQTFTVPVIDDGKANAGTTVGLVLSNPSNGLALTSPSSALLAINNTDSGTIPSGNGTALQVVDVRRFGIHEQPTTLVVTFNQAVDPATAQNRQNYVVLSPGKDGQYGTRDDAIVPIISAGYNATTNSVTLLMSRQLDVHKNYRLALNGNGSGAIATPDGSLLDGNKDGTPGGNFATTINFSSLSFSSGVARTPAKFATKAFAHPKHAKVTTKWAHHVTARGGH